jgi:hypothetical protein
MLQVAIPARYASVKMPSANQVRSVAVAPRDGVERLLEKTLLSFLALEGAASPEQKLAALLTTRLCDRLRFAAQVDASSTPPHRRRIHRRRHTPPPALRTQRAREFCDSKKEKIIDFLCPVYPSHGRDTHPTTSDFLCPVYPSHGRDTHPTTSLSPFLFKMLDERGRLLNAKKSLRAVFEAKK